MQAADPAGTGVWAAGQAPTTSGIANTSSCRGNLQIGSHTLDLLKVTPQMASPQEHCSHHHSAPNRKSYMKWKHFSPVG